MDPITAIVNSDLGMAESLRGTLSNYDVASIIDLYRSTSDWKQKDVAVHLLQDCDSVDLESVMHDVLQSPTAETRAIAFCCLGNDSNMFDQFIRNGFVDPELVDSAIRARFAT